MQSDTGNVALSDCLAMWLSELGGCAVRLQLNVCLRYTVPIIIKRETTNYNLHCSAPFHYRNTTNALQHYSTLTLPLCREEARLLVVNETSLSSAVFLVTLPYHSYQYSVLVVAPVLVGRGCCIAVVYCGML
jgi:hypothetical protein